MSRRRFVFISASFSIKILYLNLDSVYNCSLIVYRYLLFVLHLLCFQQKVFYLKIKIIMLLHFPNLIILISFAPFFTLIGAKTLQNQQVRFNFIKYFKFFLKIVRNEKEMKIKKLIKIKNVFIKRFFIYK